MVGMVGKNCVGIATDRRLGKQMLTISNHFQKVFKMQDNIILGLSGLASDVLTLYVSNNIVMLKWKIELIFIILEKTNK
jgi:20S proteasome alpha/beta subunit